MFSFALNLLMLAVPLYSIQIYDRVLGSGRVETLVLLTLIAVAALAALGAFEMVRSSLLARTASRFEQILAEPVVAAAARQPGPGASGLRELAQLRQALTGPAMAALFDVPWLPMALVALWFVHPALGAFAAASAVVLALLAVANDVLTRRAQRLAARSQSDAQTLTEAMARKPEPVLAMGMLDAMAARIGRLHTTSLDGAAERQRAERRGHGRDPGAAAVGADRRHGPGRLAGAAQRADPRRHARQLNPGSARRWRRSSRWSAPGRRSAAPGRAGAGCASC